MEAEITNKILSLIRKIDSDETGVLRQNNSSQNILRDINIELSENGSSADVLNNLIDQLVEKGVKTNNGLFMNQMFGKQQSIAVLGDILTALLNTSMYTYEVAPVLTLIEKECIKKLGAFVWGTDATSDGVFTPGSSISNMNAMVLARNAKFPESKKNGLFGNNKFSIFVSDKAHYSFDKGALFLGMGENVIVKVKSDVDGKIDISSLNSAIKNEISNGNTPLMLVGIAGTTVSGVYDNLLALSAIANHHKMWFHVDGAYGASLLFSSTEKHKLNGIQHADSVSWSLHKMMGVPLVCAVLLTKNKGVLENSFSVDADYLFHDDTDLNLGQKSLQCGRRVDSLKLWLAWKSEGNIGFENRINRLIQTAQQFADKIEQTENLELLCLPETPIVCFRFTNTGFSLTELNELNKTIRETIFNKGEILFNYSTYNNTIYLRCAISDPNMDDKKIDSIIAEVLAAGKKLITPYKISIMTKHNIKNLAEIKDLLRGLSQEQYGRKLEILTNASIGQHVRHILEFYQCLFKGEQSKEVNYDARERDLKLETDVYFSINALDDIINALLDVRSDFPVTFMADYSVLEDQKSDLIKSSFYRELAYNLEHSIHHQALIKIAITEMKLGKLVKETFGFAPSTIRHNNTCAQ